MVEAQSMDLLVDKMVEVNEQGRMLTHYTQILALKSMRAHSMPKESTLARTILFLLPSSL